MISDQKHRVIGKILNYPDCCVEAWIRQINDFRPAPVGITERIRTREEFDALARLVSAVIGRDWGVDVDFEDLRKHYVPCKKCHPLGNI